MGKLVGTEDQQQCQRKRQDLTQLPGLGKGGDALLEGSGGKGGEECGQKEQQARHGGSVPRHSGPDISSYPVSSLRGEQPPAS